MTATASAPYVDKPYFRTTRTAGYLQGVDRKKNIIYGAKLIELGDVNDTRPWTVDRMTLDQTVELGSRRNKGLKSRFAHPNMSNDGLGTFVGNWRRLRIIETDETDFVVGNLHLSQSAFATPRGDLGTYLLDLAEQDPDAFGVSLATKLAEEMFEPGDDDDSPRPIRFTDIHAADFVDSPAATRGGLFAVDFNDPKDLAPLMDWIIETHFHDLAPEQVAAKAQRYLTRHFGRPLHMANAPNAPNIDPNAAANEPVNEPANDPANQPPNEPTGNNAATPTPQLNTNKPPAAPTTPDHGNIAEASRPYREAFGEQRGAQWFCEGLSFEQAASRHRQAQADQIEALQQQVTDLNAQVEALMGESTPLPAGAPTDQTKDQTAAVRGAIRRGE